MVVLKVGMLDELLVVM